MKDIILTIAQKELRDALRNKWFLLFTIAFAGLALALSALAQPTGGADLRLSSYNRTAAGLVNLVLLFIPLIGLTLGASNITSEQETGALAYLLAQPVTRTEVLLGKYVGLAGALFASLCSGFGVAGIALSMQGQVTDTGGYLFTVILACLLGLSMLSVGFLISTIAQKTSTALGGSLFLWLVFVFAGDLGLMGTAIITKMPIETIFFTASLNPLQLFKMASILSIQANLEVLGPVGIYASETLGNSLYILIFGGLVLWVIIPLGLAIMLFTHQENKVWFKRGAQ